MLVWEMGSLLRSLIEPLLDPGHRVYAPFLLTSLLLAGGAFAWRGVPLRAVPRRLFSTRVWLHRSAQVDYLFCLCRAFLRWGGLVPHGLASFGLAAGLVALLDAQLGSAPQLEIAASTVTTLYTVVLFLVWDLSLIHI